MIEDRLTNWAHHYRDRHERGYCYSIEGRMYHAPWRQWVELSEIPMAIVVDWKDAEIVEQAWRKMSGQQKKLLKYWYMTKMPHHVLSRKCHFPIWRLPLELKKAHNAIEKILDMSMVNAIMTPQFDPLRREDQRNDAGLVRPKETQAA